jgi:hypothetical protein
VSNPARSRGSLFRLGLPFLFALVLPIACALHEEDLQKFGSRADLDLSRYSFSGPGWVLRYCRR